MRVAFLVGSLHVGGSELAAFRTARAVAGHVELVVHHLPADGPLLARYREAGLAMRHAPIGGMKSPRLVPGLLALAGALRRERIEVLHCHDYYANIIGALVAMLVPGLRLITSRRWRYEYHGFGHRTLDHWAARRADRVLANSDDLRRLLVAEVGVSPTRVGLLLNFIADTALDAPRPPREAGRLVVGSLGRLSAVKNLRLALDAMIALMPRVAGLEWHLAGDGEQREQLVEWIAQSGLADRIRLVGTVPDGIAAARGFDVLLLTSTSEGSPNAVLEAMAAGTPVVATAVGGVPEIVVDEVSGLLVASGDVAGVVRALERVLASDTLRATLASGGRQVAERRRESRVIAALVDTYRDVIATGRR